MTETNHDGIRSNFAETIGARARSRVRGAAAAALIAGAILLLVAPGADAQRGGGYGWDGDGWGGGGRGPGWGCALAPSVMAELNLSDEQLEEIDALYDRMLEDRIPLLQDLDELRLRMRELWEAERPDEEAVISLHREMDALRQKLREHSVRFQLDVLDLLTPRQRETYRRLQSMRGHGRGAGNGRGAGRGWRWR